MPANNKIALKPFQSADAWRPSRNPCSLPEYPSRSSSSNSCCPRANERLPARKCRICSILYDEQDPIAALAKSFATASASTQTVYVQHKQTQTAGYTELWPKQVDVATQMEPQVEQGTQSEKLFMIDKNARHAMKNPIYKTDREEETRRLNSPKLVGLRKFLQRVTPYHKGLHTAKHNVGHKLPRDSLELLHEHEEVKVTNEPERRHAAQYNHPHKDEQSAHLTTMPRVLKQKSNQHFHYQANTELDSQGECARCKHVAELSKQMLELQQQLARQQQQSRQLEEALRCLKSQQQTATGPKCASAAAFSCKSASSASNFALEAQVSSVCQLCKDKELPVLDELTPELRRLMGKRCCYEIMLMVLLRADNLYHVSVQDMQTHQVLGCLLASHRAIEQAVNLGVFDQIFTLNVIDVRNTIRPIGRSFGIPFEFVACERDANRPSYMRLQLPQEVAAVARGVAPTLVPEISEDPQIEDSNICKLINTVIKQFQHRTIS